MTTLLTFAATLLAPALAALVTGAARTQRLGPGPGGQAIRRTPPGRHPRRAFLRWSLLGALAVGLAEIGLVVVRFAWNNQASGFGTEIVAARLATLPPVGGPPLRHQEGRFYLMHNAEGLLALYWTCTHLGCTVPWNEQEGRFHCPCHESQFDRHGVLIEGPAPRPLDLMRLRVEGDAVIVNTGAIIQRTAYDPSQSTPV